MKKIVKLTESQLLKFVKNIVEELEYHDVDEMYKDRVEDVMSSVVLHSDPEDFDNGREFAFEMILGIKAFCTKALHWLCIMLHLKRRFHLHL